MLKRSLEWSVCIVMLGLYCYCVQPRAATAAVASCDAIAAICSTPKPFLCPPKSFAVGTIYCVSPTGAIIGVAKGGTAAIVIEVWVGGALAQSMPVVIKSPGGGFYQQLDLAYKGKGASLLAYTIGSDGTRTAFDGTICKTVPGATTPTCIQGFAVTW